MEQGTNIINEVEGLNPNATNTTTNNKSDITNNYNRDALIMDRRQRLILMLLQKVCSYSDPTPKLFLTNVVKLHELGVLSNLNFLQNDWLPNPNRLLSITSSSNKQYQ